MFSYKGVCEKPFPEEGSLKSASQLIIKMFLLSVIVEKSFSLLKRRIRT